MGDRANCVVKQEATEAEVFLYTHWGGSDLPIAVQSALKREQRWGDPAYLTRIIFDTMTEGQHGEETGFGISTSPCDNSYPFIVVDTAKQEVRFEGDDTREALATFTFKDYCTLVAPDYPA